MSSIGSALDLDCHSVVCAFLAGRVLIQSMFSSAHINNMKEALDSTIVAAAESVYTLTQQRVRALGWIRMGCSRFISHTARSAT